MTLETWNFIQHFASGPIKSASSAGIASSTSTTVSREVTAIQSNGDFTIPSAAQGSGGTSVAGGVSQWVTKL